MKEEEIRPKQLFGEYLKLSIKDGNSLNKKLFVEIDCQVCKSPLRKILITKYEYTYKQCEECRSVLCSPRPSEKQLSQLYFNSESSRFWSEVFFPSVAEARKEKLFTPKAQQIASLIHDRKLNINSICDIGAGHGVFLEELKRFLPDAKLYAIEPDSSSASECRKKGIETLEEVSENAHIWNGKFDMVISSEVIEHVFDVASFIRSLHSLLKPNGVALITGLGYEGFDILTLGEKSNSISPPHHLNFLSLEGFHKVFKNNDFRIVDVWTPGKLDVDIVINSGLENEFVNTLKSRGEIAIQDFQDFLVKHKLSSHVWVLAQK